MTMTVQELIEELTELDDLDTIYINKDGCCEIYEGEEIDFIDEETLNLSVINYDIRVEGSKKRKYRVVDIDC